MVTSCPKLCCFNLDTARQQNHFIKFHPVPTNINAVAVFIILADSSTTIQHNKKLVIASPDMPAANNEITLFLKNFYGAVEK